MKIIFTLLFFIDVISIQTKNILYTDSNIQWLGRWNENEGTGKWSGWGGPQIVFKVHGTSIIVVNTDVVDPDNSSFCLLEWVIDNSTENSNFYQLTTLEETYAGSRSATITLPDTNMHTLILHTNGYNAALWGARQKTIVKSFDIDAAGEIVTWVQGAKKLQTVGDSWMAADADYPRQMNRTKWQLYPVATGGLKASDMDTQYNYSYSGSSASDPDMDAIIVSFGVNDFNAGVTTADFQTSLNSVVNKIQINQPDVPIYLIQAPKNLQTGKDFGKYGENMQNIADQHKNVYYISTRTIEACIGWQADTYHLDDNSKIIMADYVDSSITEFELSVQSNKAGCMINGCQIIKSK